jgi:hypothetical protein
MRALATLTALLMLLSPLAAADGDSGSSSGPSGSDSGSSSATNSTSEGPSPDGNSTANSTSPSPPPPPPPPAQCPMPERRPATEEEVQACKERFCDAHPRERACREERQEEADDAADNASAERGPREWSRWCRGEAREDQERSRCRADLARFGDAAAGKWIAFRVDAANATLLDYSVAGRPVLDSLHLETGSDNLTVRATGAALRLGDDDTGLLLNDDPTGLVRLKAADGSLLLVLPDGTRVDRTDDGTVARITYGDGRIAHLRIGNATWLDGRTVLAEGFAALLVQPPEEKSGHDDQVQAEVKDAIEDRKVGAEITLHAPPAHGAATTADSSVQVLEYDDLQVEVHMPAGEVATPDAPIRVELSADLKEGRTVVLNVNRSLLEATDPQALVLRYFDLHEQADGTVLETEVVFHQAASLQDVLDPTDDSGSPEYWVVQDANGVQLMASVPHWSAHAITIGSVALLHVTPSVAVGIAAGVAGSVVAAVAMLWPRRRLDE